MIDKESDLTSFTNAIDKMVAKNGHSWNELSDFYGINYKIREYTDSEIQRVLNSGSLEEQQKLSRNYFLKNGLYKQLIIYYATLLLYSGILIPNSVNGTSLSNSAIKKKYNAAIDYLDKINIPKVLTNFSIHSLVEGCYYGVIRSLSKTEFTILDLPIEYCRSYFKDFYGNDIIEFNVGYFDTINDKYVRDQALKVYPEVISSYYKRWIKKLRTISNWVRIPSDIAFCFPLFDDARPLFIDIIPAALDYDKAVGVEKERDLDEIRKIIVQHMPHLNDGTLVFEPDEAAVMHDGAVGMLSGNKNISVLTTYADVDSVVSKAASEANTNNLQKMYQNVYANAGTTSQIFAPEGSQAIPYSLKRGLSLMMMLAHKYESFISYIINQLFGNTNLNFTYKILPISYYNQSEYITDTLKLADKGYSFILPVLACGISQKELINIKKLENDLLKLDDLMVPLKSSYTESTSVSGNGPGAPEKKLEDKSPKTIQNENAIDNQGGQDG